MKKFLKGSMCITMSIILLFVSSITSFATQEEPIDEYIYTISGKESIVRVLLDNEDEKIVERKTEDGRIIITTYDKVRNTLTREELSNEKNRLFQNNIKNNIISIDLNEKNYSNETLSKSNIISPNSIEEEFTEEFKGSLYGTYSFHRRDFVGSSIHLVYLTLSIRNDSLYTGALNNYNTSDKNIISRGENFKYNVKNADKLGGTYNDDLSESMMVYGSTKSFSSIKSFVVNTTLGLAQSIKSHNSAAYEDAFFDLLFTFSDVAIPFTSFAIRGAVVSANVHNCNQIFEGIKNSI